jgi:hypothetical protein
MFRNYLKITRRNLWRNKGFSAINIFGLAIGMAACFFIFQYVYFESTYDRFNTNATNIYRVPVSYSGSMANTPTTAANRCLSHQTKPFYFHYPAGFIADFNAPYDMPKVLKLHLQIL